MLPVFVLQFDSVFTVKGDLLTMFVLSAAGDGPHIQFIILVPTLPKLVDCFLFVASSMLVVVKGVVLYQSFMPEWVTSLFWNRVLPQ